MGEGSHGVLSSKAWVTATLLKSPPPAPANAWPELRSLHLRTAALSPTYERQRAGPSACVPTSTVDDGGPPWCIVRIGRHCPTLESMAAVTRNRHAHHY